MPRDKTIVYTRSEYNRERRISGATYGCGWIISTDIQEFSVYFATPPVKPGEVSGNTFFPHTALKHAAVKTPYDALCSALVSGPF